MTLENLYINLYWTDLTPETQAQIMAYAHKNGFEIQKDVLDDQECLDFLILDEDGIR